MMICNDTIDVGAWKCKRTIVIEHLASLRTISSVSPVIAWLCFVLFSVPIICLRQAVWANQLLSTTSHFTLTLPCLQPPNPAVAVALKQQWLNTAFISQHEHLESCLILCFLTFTCHTLRPRSLHPNIICASPSSSSFSPSLLGAHLDITFYELRFAFCSVGL